MRKTLHYSYVLGVNRIKRKLNWNGLISTKKQKNNYGNIDINLLNYGLDTSITEVLILCLLIFFLPGILQLNKSKTSLIAPNIFNNLWRWKSNQTCMRETGLNLTKKTLTFTTFLLNYMLGLLMCPNFFMLYVLLCLMYSCVSNVWCFTCLTWSCVSCFPHALYIAWSIY